MIIGIFLIFFLDGHLAKGFIPKSTSSLEKNFVRNLEEKQPVQIELINDYGSYYLSADIGANKQNLKLMLSTLLKETVAISPQCNICNGINFLDESSKTLKRFDEKVSISLYRPEMIGNLCQDSVLLKPWVGLKQRNFTLVQQVNYADAFNIDGFFGVGFTKEKSDHFVYLLKSAGLIESAIFGLLLRGQSESSLLHLGGFYPKLINETEAKDIGYADVRFTEADPRIDWHIIAESVSLSGNVTSTPPKVSTAPKLVLDSASQVIRIPKSFFFSNIKSIFQKSSKCQIGTDDIFHCNCDDYYDGKFPTFNFSFGGFSLLLKPEDYIVLHGTLTTNDLPVSCTVLLAVNYKDDHWILGANFMTNYYTIFDLENARLGFYSVRGKEFGSFSEILYLSMVIVIISIIFFSAIYIIWNKYSRRSPSRRTYLRDQDSLIEEEN